MLKFVPIFTVRIVYKSGYHHDIECTEFKITWGEAKRVEWKEASPQHQILYIGLDDVAAVFQTKTRKELKWVKK